jgi:basic membrane protein A and related proteins
MSKRLCLVLSVILTASMLLAACAPAAPVQPTTAPAATAAAPTTAATLPNGSSIKVGLVTDTGGVNDQSFNQLAWQGVQKAATDMGFQAKFLESTQPSDYETNIDALAAEGYNVIITVGSQMGDVTALKAQQYPDIKFAIIDNAYAISGLANVTSLMFAEEQIGFLAGVLAGGMSRSGFVCSVSSLRTPASGRYMVSFFQGASWQAGPETDGSVTAGISTGTLQNGGVGLAPFHDWDSKIPADLKAQIQQASDGIRDGSIQIDLPQ